MKPWITSLFMIILIFSMNLGSTFSSEKVSELIARDASEMLDTLTRKKGEINEYKKQLENIDIHLKKTNLGQVTYLQFDRIAGSLIIVGVMIGSYKTHFPPGLRAMIAGYTTVTGISRGMIKLSPDLFKLFVHHVSLLNSRIKIANEKLDQQVKYYCNIYPYHEQCR
ncbi:MAG: hypothetical protein K2Q18_14095 [Bdellovibrionales bacterium]|nr:hypothetical protein [Bdellovibrionales bacterium]